MSSHTDKENFPFRVNVMNLSPANATRLLDALADRSQGERPRGWAKFLNCVSWM